MSNHYNVLITSPNGVRTFHFIRKVSLDDCKEFIKSYGPAPSGWFYQIYNYDRKRRIGRIPPDYKLVTGFNKDREFVDQRQARNKSNGSWHYSVKNAKNDMRKMGCTIFRVEKVWIDDKTS